MAFSFYCRHRTMPPISITCGDYVRPYPLETRRGGDRERDNSGSLDGMGIEIDHNRWSLDGAGIKSDHDRWSLDGVGIENNDDNNCLIVVRAISGI